MNLAGWLGELEIGGKIGASGVVQPYNDQTIRFLNTHLMGGLHGHPRRFRPILNIFPPTHHHGFMDE